MVLRIVGKGILSILIVVLMLALAVAGTFGTVWLAEKLGVDLLKGTVSTNPGLLVGTIGTFFVWFSSFYIGVNLIFGLWEKKA